MKLLLFSLLAFFAAVITGWFSGILTIGIFCDGYQPNWLCSGHGGAWLGISLLTMFISFPIYIYLFLYKN
jgi:sterol desaturase/sphingolipid hydroxylase (fatty acid hydroxylase superfamily)